MAAIVYSTGSSGASNRAAVWDAIRSALLSAGWTETIVSATSGLRQSAFTGIAIDQIAGNAPVILVGENVASSFIYFQSGADWDPATKTFIAQCGDNSINSGFNTDATQNLWSIRVNGYALFVNNQVNGAGMWKAYVGWMKRGLSVPRAGITKATSTLSIGATSIPVASDLRNRLQVGQKLTISNFAHVTGNANAAHCERVTITSLGASSIGVSALAKAYDTGALVGDRCMNVAVMGNCFVEWGNCTTPYYKDGSRTGNTNQVGFYSAVVQGTSTVKPDANSTERPTGDIQHTWNSGSPSTANGLVGRPFHVILTQFDTQGYHDLFDDGVRQYEMIGITTGIAACVATS